MQKLYKRKLVSHVITSMLPYARHGRKDTAKTKTVLSYIEMEIWHKEDPQEHQLLDLKPEARQMHPSRNLRLSKEEDTQ